MSLANLVGISLEKVAPDTVPYLFHHEKDRATIEKTFEALFTLVLELDEEEDRAMRGAG